MRLKSPDLERSERAYAMESVSSLQARPRVLLADDHALFVDALRVYLEKSYTVVRVVSDGRNLVTDAVRLRPDLLIINISLPSLNGLDAARRIREQAGDTKFLFVTMREDPILAAAAVMEFGSIGFVLKHLSGQELLTAINHVMNRKTYLSPRLRSADRLEMEFRAKKYSNGLAARQRDVVQLVAEGKPLKQVADHLDLSLKTVEFHKQRVMDTFSQKATPISYYLP